MPSSARILEGIVTTERADGGVNIAPMGPRVDEAFGTLLLRPYQTSETFANLVRARAGVLHVTDDVELFARAAIDRWEAPPELERLDAPPGCFVLAGACRWYAFEVTRIDDSHQRSQIECRVVRRGRQRDFFGFNRGMHAVIEAAILATRLDLLPIDEVRRELDRLAVLVEKTGGPREHAAFEWIGQFVRTQIES